jgi:hypothetical protein
LQHVVCSLKKKKKKKNKEKKGRKERRKKAKGEGEEKMKKKGRRRWWECGALWHHRCDLRTHPKLPLELPRIGRLGGS